MSIQELPPPPAPSLPLVWGAKNIARAIGLNRRQAFQKLQSGELPGAKKIAGSWVLDVSVFRASFREVAP